VPADMRWVAKAAARWLRVGRRMRSHASHAEFGAAAVGLMAHRDLAVGAARREDASVSHSNRGGESVPKYLWKVSYTKAGVRGVAKEGASSRRDAVRHAIESLGGELEAVYFAFGEADVYVIGELPDNQSAAALSLAANVSEGLTAETVVLMTPEEFDAATEKDVSFRPPAE
jgi:uncharacterized protein with GYD domain